MISGHDDTISSQVLFIMKYFNISLEKYKLPGFAGQISVEVTRNKEKENNEEFNYSDYRVCYYFNDELFINVTLNEFIDTIEKNAWTKKEMDNFCFRNDDNDEDNKGKEDKDKNNDNKENNREKIDNNNNVYLYIVIAMGILIAILCVIIIILILKLKKKDLNEDDNSNKGLINNDED